MKVIDAAALDYKTLNEVLRQPEHDYVIEGCCGHALSAPECLTGILPSMEFPAMLSAPT